MANYFSYVIRCLFIVMAMMMNSSFAGVYQTAVAATGLVGSGSAWTYTASSAVAANQAFATTATVRAAGTAITMPASARFASNAARFAVSAARLNPTVIAVGAVAAWLLPYGIQWLNNQWQYTPQGASTGYSYQIYQNCSTGPSYGTWSSDVITQATNALCLPANFQARVTSCGTTVNNGSIGCTYIAPGVDGNNPHNMNFQAAAGCSSGYTLVSGTCRTVTTPRPAVDADFEAASNSTLPEAAAVQVAKVSPLPVEAPKLVEVVDQPISAPYTDPVTKTQKRDFVSASPAPTADDPLRTHIETYTQQVDANGAPLTSATPTAKDPDFCQANPDAVMCKKFDVPDDPDVQTQTKNVAISPDSGWGPESAACPADRVLRSGAHISYATTCENLSMMRPITIACAWLTAALIVAFGARRAQP